MTEYFIGFRMFAALDSRGTGEQEGQREAALKQEFMALIPASSRLRSSHLVTQRHHTDMGCRLEFYLWQRPQYAFDFNGTGEPPPAGDNEIAAFQEDVERVKAECKDVKTRLILAQSPTLDHQALTASSSAALDRKALRSLFRRRSRVLVMPTPSGGLDLNLPAAPAHLATGVQCTLSSRVTKMTPTYMAHLRDLRLVRTEHDYAIPAISLPDSALACRKKLSPHDAAGMLKSMDDQATIEIAAKLVFDWATGAIKRMYVMSVKSP